MTRRHVVRDLSDEEFQFVIDRLIAGDTDRELEAAFLQTFDKKLAKSSINRWRKSAGDELADRYRLARYTAKQLLADLGQEDADKYQIVIANIEDRMLTSLREVIAQDPVKLLRIRQDEEKRRIKERELGLKERALDMEAEKRRGAKHDPAKLPGEILEHLLEFVGSDPAGLSWFKANAKKLESYFTEKYADQA
jgi:hypothetical protein